jgi:hypothetical protein
LGSQLRHGGDFAKFCLRTRETRTSFIQTNQQQGVEGLSVPPAWGVDLRLNKAGPGLTFGQ